MQPLLLACVLLIGLCSCRQPDAATALTGQTVVDQLGRQVTISRPANRIVSMAPSVTEMLYALGVWDRVVGVTSYDQYPSDAETRAKIGDILRPNLEVIVSLKPDLVVATISGNYRETVDRLQSLGVPVFVLSAGRVEEIYHGFQLLGEALDEQSRAEAIVTRMQRSIEQLGARLAGRPRREVLYLTWVDPPIVPGREAFETDALALAGIDSLTRNHSTHRYPRYSLEQIIRLGPEYILTVEHNTEGVRRLITSRAWASVPAVRKKQVHIVSDLIQHPSQRIVEGIEEVARKIYPEAFASQN